MHMCTSDCPIPAPLHRHPVIGSVFIGPAAFRALDPELVVVETAKGRWSGRLVTPAFS